MSWLPALPVLSLAALLPCVSWLLKLGLVCQCVDGPGRAGELAVPRPMCMLDRPRASAARSASWSEDLVSHLLHLSSVLVLSSV